MLRLILIDTMSLRDGKIRERLDRIRNRIMDFFDSDEEEEVEIIMKEIEREMDEIRIEDMEIMIGGMENLTTEVRRLRDRIRDIEYPDIEYPERRDWTFRRYTDKNVIINSKSSEKLFSEKRIKLEEILLKIEGPEIDLVFETDREDIGFKIEDRDEFGIIDPINGWWISRIDGESDPPIYYLVYSPYNDKTFKDFKFVLKNESIENRNIEKVDIKYQTLEE